MKYLLDTQAWIWSVLDDPRLSRRARAALRTVSGDEHVGLAAISLKEASTSCPCGSSVSRARAGSDHRDDSRITADVRKGDVAGD